MVLNLDVANIHTKKSSIWLTFSIPLHSSYRWLCIYYSVLLKSITGSFIEPAMIHFGAYNVLPEQGFQWFVVKRRYTQKFIFKLSAMLLVKVGPILVCRLDIHLSEVAF